MQKRLYIQTLVVSHIDPTLRICHVSKIIIFLGKNMSTPMNPHEQADFDQFKEDREEQIEQIMIEKKCSKVEAEAIWEKEYAEAKSQDDQYKSQYKPIYLVLFQ